MFVSFVKAESRGGAGMSIGARFLEIRKAKG
jgi:hypothetical protein